MNTVFNLSAKPVSNWQSFFLHRVTRNVLFWTLFAGIPIWFNWNNFGSHANFLTDIEFYFKCAFLGYFNNLVLIPRLFDRGRVSAYFLVIGAVILVTEYISLFLIVPLLSDYLNTVSSRVTTYLYSLEDTVFFVGSFLAAAFLSRLTAEKKKSKNLTELQAETELAFLKAQINPHFLFNTINMLYSYALERSAAIPNLLLKLAENMRYVLHEGSQERVGLSEEINFLMDYVALQKLRLEGRANVNFKVIRGPNSETAIAPLLLIVFIENAFKYAGEGQVDNIKINITINETTNGIEFTCSNTATISDVPSNQDYSGIGLVNVKKRLDLIYQQNYQLIYGLTSNSKYQVSLSLPNTTFQ